MARIEAHLDEEGGVGMTADKQLKAYIDRVLRLKEEQDTIGDDIREIYAEAKAAGYDKTIMGKLVAHLRRELKQGAGAVAEAESIFDTYLNAYQRASGTPVATHTHEEEFDPITGEFVNDRVTIVDRDDEDGNHLRVTVDARIAAILASNAPERPSHNDEPSPEVGPQAEASPAGTGAGTLADREGRHEGEAATVGLPTDSRSDDDAIAAVKGKARLANVNDVEPSSSAPIAPAAHGEAEAPSVERVSPENDTSSAAANAGGRHVNAQPHRAATAGALVQVAPATKPLRPHCRNAGEHCGGYGSNHCHACLRAAREPELEACT